MFAVSFIGDQALMLGWFFRCGKEYFICIVHTGRSVQAKRRARVKHNARPRKRARPDSYQKDGYDYV